MSVNAFLQSFAFYFSENVICLHDRGDCMNIGEQIKKVRQEKGLSQKALGQLLGVSQQHIAQYETGKRQIPLDALKKLAIFYNTSIDYILELTDEEKPYPRSVKH